MTTCGRATSRCGRTPPRSTRRAGWWFGVDNETMAGIYPWEDWILARSVVGPIPGVDEERDLFAGVRERVTQ